MLTFEERVLCGNPLQRFRSGLEPDPEPTWEFGPVANTNYPPTSPRLSKFHTVCRSLRHFATCGHSLEIPSDTSDDADVARSFSEGVDPSSSQGVDPSSFQGVDLNTSCTAAKLLSVLVRNLSCRSIVRLLTLCIPLEHLTAAIVAIGAIAAIRPLRPFPPLQSSHIAKGLTVRYRSEESSFALLNHCLESIWCRHPGCVCNASATLWPHC